MSGKSPVGDPSVLPKEFPGNHRWPQWFPDGTRIIFESVGGSQREVADAVQMTAENYVVPALGGIPRRLTEPSIGRGFVWSPDGEQLAYKQGNGIYIRSVVEDVSTKIAEGFEPFPLSWSRDGTKIAYASGNVQYVIGGILANIAPSSLWIVQVAGGDPVRVTEKRPLGSQSGLDSGWEAFALRLEPRRQPGHLSDSPGHVRCAIGTAFASDNWPQCSHD